MESETKSIEWSVYAEHYDVMCEINPSYNEMISLVADQILQLDISSTAKILDIGAGTGNLLSRLHRSFPTASFFHLDQDPVMNRRARAKYKQQGLHDVTFIEDDFLSFCFNEDKFDLIVSTNAIYAITPHTAALRKVSDILSDEGHFVIVDFGKKQNTNDWILYLTVENLKRFGVRKTLEIFRKNWEIAKQNQNTTSAQLNGSYWTHDLEEFVEALTQTGFTTLHTQKCYRGYSDLAVCVKESYKIRALNSLKPVIQHGIA